MGQEESTSEVRDSDTPCSSAQEKPADDELRVVLLGKTGAGKSSLGNTLIGRKVFEVYPGMGSGTYERQVCTRIRFGTKLQVTDTPGLFDTHRQEAEVAAEVRDTVMAVPPGPHILILVLRCDSRFTQEEYSVFTKLKTMFGASICRHMIVVFNGIDHLDDSPVTQRAALDEEVQMYTGKLRHVLDDVSYRYYGVTNKASRSTRDAAACEVIDMMKSLAAENFWTYLGLNDLTSSSDDDDEDEKDDEDNDDDD
ncbi:hypothetical protein ACOMHN_054554 [Nucella lapillus]